MTLDLYVEQYGTGPRTAILVHGMSDDHTTWGRVAPHLLEQGYRVLAPDLRGHGRSPRGERYLLADYAADLVASLPVGADLLVGHSLGALAVGLAASALAPQALVHLDPPWRTSLPAVPVEEGGGGPATWSAEDLAADTLSSELMDPAVPRWVPTMMAQELLGAIPSELVAPTLVVEPSSGALTEEPVRQRLTVLGYEFRSLPGVRHVMHRDDLTAFLAVLDDWVSGGGDGARAAEAG